MSITIQLATESHLDQLLSFVRAYHQFEALDTTEQLRAQSVRRLLCDHDLGRIWLILDSSAAVGYIALCKGYSIEFGGYDAFIDEFFIDQNARGRGIGTKVLALVKAEAMKLGIRALHLEVARTNSRAQKLYQAANFKPRTQYMLMSVSLT